MFQKKNKMLISPHYTLANQKLLHELDIIDKNIDALQHRILMPPCITLNGIDSLTSNQKMHCSSTEHYKNIIYHLFTMLNLPTFWIHSIDYPHNVNKLNCKPNPSVNIYLITDSIKMYVYKTLKKHFKTNNQKFVSIKLLTP